MDSGGFHMNVNVLNRETLLDAMEHPENYPQLTIRVSGYAVNFVRLTRSSSGRDRPHVPHERVAEAMAKTNLNPQVADVADGSRIGFVHSSETTSGVNGPGLRYTVFLSGCPLRCLYCHNPDTQTMRLG